MNDERTLTQAELHYLLMRARGLGIEILIGDPDKGKFELASYYQENSYAYIRSNGKHFLLDNVESAVLFEDVFGNDALELRFARGKLKWLYFKNRVSPSSLLVEPKRELDIVPDSDNKELLFTVNGKVIFRVGEDEECSFHVLFEQDSDVREQQEAAALEAGINIVTLGLLKQFFEFPMASYVLQEHSVEELKKMGYESAAEGQGIVERICHLVNVKNGETTRERWLEVFRTAVNGGSLRSDNAPWNKGVKLRWFEEVSRGIADKQQ